MRTWCLQPHSNMNSRFISKFGLIDCSMLWVLPMLLAVSPALLRKGRTGFPTEAWMVHLNLTMPNRMSTRWGLFQGAAQQQEDTVPSQRVLCPLPTHMPAHAHRRWGTWENVQQRDKSLSILPVATGSKLCRRKATSTWVSLGFCGLFFLKHHNTFRAGTCFYRKVPHDFSRSRSQIFHSTI